MKVLIAPKRQRPSREFKNDKLRKIYISYTESPPFNYQYCAKPKVRDGAYYLHINGSLAFSVGLGINARVGRRAAEGVLQWSSERADAGKRKVFK